MPENPKQQNRQTNASESDEFWALDTMLPEKKITPPPALPDTAPEDVLLEEPDEAQSLAGQTAAALFDRANPLRGQRDGAALPLGAEIFADKNRATPGDVKPQMRQPVTQYEPSDGLIRRVAVWRWPAKYSFYDRFRSDAMRHFDRKGEPSAFVPFYAYMPQYYQMTAPQLNYYFLWRDGVRRGEYLKTEYSYLFLYLYEIINLPEKYSARAGLEQMCCVWLAYRESFPRLDRYLGEWVCDWCLIHELEPPLQTLRDILPLLPEKVSLKEFYIRYSREGDCPLNRTLTDMLSGYQWQASKYVTPQNRPLFEKHLYASVLQVLQTMWEKSDDPESMLGLREVTQTRDAFGGALCSFTAKRRIDVTYISFSRSYPLHFLVTDLYKFAENNIRAHLGIRARLSVSALDEGCKKQMRAYFDANLPAKSKTDREAAKREAALQRRQEERGERMDPSYAHFYAPREQALDPETARSIERASWKTTRLLVTEESEADLAVAPVVADATQPPEQSGSYVPDAPAQAEARDESEDPYVRLIFGLSAEHFALLTHIVNGEKAAFESACRAARLTAQGVVSEINDCAVQNTEDVILEEDGDGFFVLVPDYASLVTDAMIRRMEREGGTADEE